ncbi:MAG TPA: alpha-amylase family protein [Bryobacteraceae bacterium]
MTRRELLSGAVALPFVPAIPGTNWLSDVYRELHLDAHFGQLQTIYEGFDAESAAGILKKAGFQMVSCFAVCGAGYSYYPTKIGVRHPALKRDFTGEMSRALKKRGIRVLAYLSVTRDHCLNSPWVDETHIPQLKEIHSLYDVDGFFLDGMIGKFLRGPCYCEYCRRAFGAEIPKSDSDPNVFAHHRFLTQKMNRYAERVTGALRNLAFVFNHVWVSRNPVNPPPAVNQLVWEPAPPYPGVLSLDFSLEARYLSTVRGVVNWSCMSTRGNGWGDYAVRDPAEYRHEAAVLLACGGRPYFGDDSYPSGNPDPAVYRVFGEVNQRTAAMEPFVKGRRPVKDIAVLLSADSIWSKLPLVPPREWMGKPSSPAVAGAHKALVEEHAQFSILNSETLAATLQDYKALVLAEQIILNPKECEAIRRFVSNGGALVVTGGTGVRDADNKPLSNFALADVLGIRYVESVNARRTFLGDTEVRGGYEHAATTSARTLIELIPAVGPKNAHGGKPAGPGVTINQFGKGRAIYASAHLFEAYFQDDTAALGKLAAWMLEQVYPRTARSLVLENAPLNIEAVYTTQGRARFVHLVSYSHDRRISAVHGIRVRLRCGTRPRQVALAPENKSIAFEWRDGWLSFPAGPVTIDSAYMIET